MWCTCWCFIFHLSCGELSPVRGILPCSRPGLGSALWKSGGSSSTSPANWWHYSPSGNGGLKALASRGGTSAAAALTYTLAMVARSPSNSTCQAHALQRVLPWRSLWSWWTTAWGASVAPLLLTSRIVHFHPPAHLLALSDQQDPSSPQPGNTNTITCSELNRITEISSCCHFMFNILLLPQSRQG